MEIKVNDSSHLFAVYTNTLQRNLKCGKWRKGNPKMETLVILGKEDFVIVCVFLLCHSLKLRNHDQNKNYNIINLIIIIIKMKIHM